MTIKDIIEGYGISVGVYYHWSNRYARDGFPGLNKKKVGACVSHNKTPEDIETKIVQIATDNNELDANDIWNIVTELYGSEGVWKIQCLHEPIDKSVENPKW